MEEEPARGRFFRQAVTGLYYCNQELKGVSLGLSRDGSLPRVTVHAGAHSSGNVPIKISSENTVLEHAWSLFRLESAGKYVCMPGSGTLCRFSRFLLILSGDEA